MNFHKLIKDNKIKTIGRTYIKNDLLYFNFSGSGITFKTDQNVNLEFYSPKYNVSNSLPYITIFINDTRMDYPLDEEYKHIVLKIHGVSNITIIKRTESPVSYAAIKMIDCDNFIEIIEEKRLKIEFYGDSITCGFGIKAMTSDEGFKTETESFTDSYAYLLSQKLNADYSVVAVSGFPIYKSRWNEGFPIDSIADMMSISDYNEKMKLENSVLWDNRKYIPDIVVIHLGTNDESYFTIGQSWVDLLIEEVNSFDNAKIHIRYQDELNNLKNKIYSFISNLFDIYGKSLKIVWCLGMLKIDEDIYNFIKSAVLSYNNPNVYFYDFKTLEYNDVFGAVFHPGQKMHNDAALELYNFIKEEVL